eukprot:TRINITY_DN4021_c0_g1_i1.p1 TRINITY_DN4021_c0_g1~~TRINITY_DN4021_c0_g1_i1.p1  ORF type:complete len:584 (+),score=63.79 TRINITY_DN4021_c0_g1_i1:1874-3625(+)
MGEITTLYLRVGQKQRALDLAKEAFEEAVNVSGMNNDVVGNTMHLVASCYTALKQPRDALTWEKQAVQLLRAVRGDEHPDVLNAMCGLASIYTYDLAQDHDALDLLEFVLQKRRQIYGNEHPDVVASLRHVAALKHSTGQYHAARLLGEEALALQLKLCGCENVLVAPLMSNLALTYVSMGRCSVALELQSEALCLLEAHYRQPHEETAKALSNMASIHFEMKNAAAVDYGERALRMQRQLTGDDDLNVAVICSNLSGTYASMSRWDEAAELCQTALRIREKLLPSEHPLIRHTMGKTIGCIAAVLRFGGEGLAANNPSRFLMLVTLLKQLQSRFSAGPQSPQPQAPDSTIAVGADSVVWLADFERRWAAASSTTSSDSDARPASPTITSAGILEPLSSDANPQSQAVRSAPYVLRQRRPISDTTANADTRPRRNVSNGASATTSPPAAATLSSSDVPVRPPPVAAASRPNGGAPVAPAYPPPVKAAHVLRPSMRPGFVSPALPNVPIASTGPVSPPLLAGQLAGTVAASELRVTVRAPPRVAVNTAARAAVMQTMVSLLCFCLIVYLWLYHPDILNALYVVR